MRHVGSGGGTSKRCIFGLSALCSRRGRAAPDLCEQTRGRHRHGVCRRRPFARRSEQGHRANEFRGGLLSADGLALAALYVIGLRFAPVVFFTYSLSACLIFHVDWHVAVVASVIGTALQAAGVTLFHRVLRGDLARGRVADLGRFFVMVAFLAILGGTLLRFTLIASGDVAPAQGNTVFFTTSTGLATGMLVIASLAALVAGRVRAWLAGGPWIGSDWDLADRRRLAIDALMLLGSTGLTVVVAFAAATRMMEPLYLCFAPIIWLALRRGLPGAAIAILVVDVAVIVAFRVQRLPPPELEKSRCCSRAVVDGAGSRDGGHGARDGAARGARGGGAPSRAGIGAAVADRSAPQSGRSPGISGGGSDAPGCAGRRRFL